MQTVAVVPMKLRNVRCPNKNVKAFTKGAPLCSYILNTLLRVKEIEEVYVYCSDEKIMEYIPKGVKYLKRPQHLDQDSTKMNEVLACFADEVCADIYVMTHATSPFVSEASFQKGIKAVRDLDYDSAFAAKKLQDFLWKDNKPMNYQLDNIPRTQDLEPIWQETSGFYIYKKSVIRDLNRRIGENPYIVEVSEIEGVDIDEQLDFEIADAIFNHFYAKED